MFYLTKGKNMSTGIDNFINKKEQAQIYLKTQVTQNNIQNRTIEDKVSPTPVNTKVRDEFVREKKNNGLIRKFYNFLKNTTHIGLGSKAVDKEIEKYEKGQITEEQVKNTISKYKSSQQNSVQVAGDTASAAVTISGYMLANNFIKKYKAMDKLNALPHYLKGIKEGAKISGFIKKLDSMLQSKSKATMLMLPVLAIAGGMTKLFVTKAERIGSKEFKVNKKEFTDKKELKAEKKKARKARRKTNFKNFLTGAVNGLLAPVTAIAGGIVGVPAYILATTGLRYQVNNKGDKSLKDFAQVFKDNAVVNSLATLAVAIPAFKKANYSHVLGKNLNKVVENLSGVKLAFPDLPSSKSAYQELEDILINSEPVQKIINPTGNSVYLALDDRITALTEENIFAVKFLQIKNKGLLTGKYNNYMELSDALRECCPPTRTLEEAQAHINKLWGSSDYTVSKLLGVGTIAETYLAKDKTGKEVCIKVLKNGINAEKIAKDKEKFVKLITGDIPADKLNDNQKYLLKNIEDLADGIAKEVDFVNEMNAAKELKKYTQVADVVVPKDVKPGIYIMEKAPGISIKTLVDYYDCERDLKWLRRDLKKHPESGDVIQNMIKVEEQKLHTIKSRAPEFEDFDLTPAQIKKLLKTYIDLQVEQFAKIDKNGKVIHADIHPGNIFINLEALKSGKGKLLTLIDTGNTVKLSKEQAMASLKVVGFIKNGNTKDLTNIVLQDAILPKGLSKEDAFVKVEKDLKTIFFDNKTKIDSMNMETFYALSDNILRKYNIIPNNTQLNLNKAKVSAKNSFENLFESFFEQKYGNKSLDEATKAEIVATVAQATKDMADIGVKYQSANSVQETKNLFQMSLKEAWNFLRNKNMLKTNSVEHLTYTMKQNMPRPKIKIDDNLEV